MPYRARRNSEDTGWIRFEPGGDLGVWICPYCYDETLGRHLDGSPCRSCGRRWDECHRCKEVHPSHDGHRCCWVCKEKLEGGEVHHHCPSCKVLFGGSVKPHRHCPVCDETLHPSSLRFHVERCVRERHLVVSEKFVSSRENDTILATCAECLAPLMVPARRTPTISRILYLSKPLARMKCSEVRPEDEFGNPRSCPGILKLRRPLGTFPTLDLGEGFVLEIRPHSQGTGGGWHERLTIVEEERAWPMRLLGEDRIDRESMAGIGFCPIPKDLDISSCSAAQIEEFGEILTSRQWERYLIEKKRLRRGRTGT